MNRPIRRIRTLALLLVSFPAASIAPARAAEPAVVSTGQIDLSIEPPIPTVATPLVVGADEKPVLVDGKATPNTYVLFSFKPPAERMFELRLFAPEGAVSMVVYRGASTRPEPGAAPSDSTEMWMSATEAGEEIRILVRGRVAGETPFKLGAKIYPKSNEAD